MKKPEISVIVPVYNVEEYLEACAESIVTQDFKDIELILVNDGSPDNCGALCDVLAAKDDRIRVIHKKNGGLSDARNAGLDAAAGAYIMFVDSDDFILPLTLSKLYKACEQMDCEIAVSHIREYGKEPEATGEVVRKNASDALQMIMIRKEWYWSACGKLYKASVFAENRFKKGWLYEDFELIPKLIYEAENIAFVDEILYEYLERSGSIMDSNRKKPSADMVRIIAGRTAYFSKQEPSGKRDVIAAGYLLHGYSKVVHLIRENFTKENKGFLKAYKKEYRRQLSRVLKSKHIVKKEKMLIAISAFSVTACKILYRWKHRETN